MFYEQCSELLFPGLLSFSVNKSAYYSNNQITK